VYTYIYVQIGTLENTRKRVIRSVITLQRYFRGYKARRQFVELKTRVPPLQSCKGLASIFAIDLIIISLTCVIFYFELLFAEKTSIHLPQLR